MAGEINFGLLDPDAVYKGVAHTNALLQGFAKLRAGRALAAGNPGQAQTELNNQGLLDEANTVKTRHWAEDDRVHKLDLEQQKESATFTADVSAALYAHLQQHKADPDGGRAAVLQAFDQITPLFMRRGAKDQDISTYKEALAKDPASLLTTIHNEAVSHLKNIVVPKDAVLADGTGKELLNNQQPEVKIVKDADGREHLVEVGGPQGAPTGAAGAAPATTIAPAPATGAGGATGGQSGAAAPATPSPDDLWGAVKTQESHNTPGAVNPETGAAGIAQVMPQTGEAMAKKLGIVWHPEMMTAKTPEAAAYQETLGKAYFQEGLDKYGGDPQKALAYYYGGPDERQWGPKTHQYVKDVLGRLGNYQVAGPVMAPGPASGVRELYAGAPASPFWSAPQIAKEGDGSGVTPGSSYIKNTKTGETKVLVPPDRSKGGAGGGSTKLSTSEQAYLRELRKQSDELQNVAGSVDEFVALNKRVKTGGALALPGAEATMSAINPTLARMVSITSKLTPAMRNGLPGAASDKDVAMFKSSTVSIGRPYESNVENAKALKALTNRVGDHVAFLEAYAKKTGSLLGAAELWKDYVDNNLLFSGITKNGAIVRNTPKPWRQAITIPGAEQAGKVRVYVPGKGFQ